MRFYRLLFLILIWVCGLTAAFASEVRGVVHAPDGAVVPQARVSLQAGNGAVHRATSTDTQGAFRLEAAPGTYALRVEAAGFAAYQQPVTVRDAGLRIDVTLQVHGGGTEVTVSAERGQVVELARSPQPVNVIEGEELEERSMMSQLANDEVGIAQQRTSPTIGAVLVRGMTDVGVYIDGVRWTQSTQRGGISTFFNLNQPTLFEVAEVLRGPNGAQYGSDSLAGTVSLTSKTPVLGVDGVHSSGRLALHYSTEDNSFGPDVLYNLSTPRFGLTADVAAHRASRLRPGGGHDTHAAVTRFLGLPSTIFGTRLPDTAFTQYGGMVSLSFLPTPDQNIMLRYQRGQQDGGKRYDQLLGGDGNLIADLRNLMLDFGYLRYQKERLGFFDHGAFTVSYNSQREERVNQGGQGNPRAAILHDKERTTTLGFSFTLDRQAGSHSLLVGADLYRDHVRAPSHAFDPVSGARNAVRPRVPNGSQYLQYGFFVQDGWEAIAQKLRISGALRYNVASYRAEEEDAPIVGGRPLFPDDSMRVADLSGRIGAALTFAPGATLTGNYSRGFRAPNITALGSVGLVGVGFQVSASELRGRHAFIGTTADATAQTSGVAVSPLRSEYTNGYDVGVNVQRGPVRASFGAFWMDYRNTIARQTLILPPGAVGTQLGSQTITQQDANGAVYVPLSTSPVLVQVNFGGSQVRGVEAELKVRFTERWSAGANYTFVRAEDDAGAPPNTEGGTLPPQTLNVSVRFSPTRKFWIEAYGTAAGRQDRLSTLALSDRRTGAARSRTQIQNFFRRGATVRGLVEAGPDGVLGTADDRLRATGETLAQVQQRVLGTANSAPLFRELPGYGYFGIRGGVHLDERTAVMLDFENINDKNYRNASWGLPAPGRALAVRVTRSF